MPSPQMSLCSHPSASQVGTSGGCQVAERLGQRTSSACLPEGHHTRRLVRRAGAGVGSTRRKSAMLTTCSRSPVGDGASREVREKATGMDNDGRAGGPAPYSRSGRRARCERRAAPWHGARTARAAAAKVRKLSRQTDSGLETASTRGVNNQPRRVPCGGGAASDPARRTCSVIDLS